MKHQKLTAALILFLIFIGGMIAYSSVYGPKPVSVPTPATRIMLVTNMGDITIELFDDMPITSANFKNLTQFGIYNGTVFSRVATDPAVIQGGDPGSKGITVPTIPDELPNKHSNVRGAVAMAKTSNPNSASSQFYINVQNNTYLDTNYSVFGKVVAGMDVVDSISQVPVDANQLPKTDVVIMQAYVLT